MPVSDMKMAALILTFVGLPAFAQFDIELGDPPKLSLEQAMPIAKHAARAKVADLDSFFLHSVRPRVLKGDPDGMHWQFLWQEAQFGTHLRGVRVRVYMSDGHAVAEEFRQ